MLLGHDVIADRETEAGALASRLGREKRLEELIPDLRRDTNAIVADADLNGVAKIPRRDRQRGVEIAVSGLLLTLGGGIKIKSVAEEVEADPSNVLRDNLNRG
jgi:hypothetical protein